MKKKTSDLCIDILVDMASGMLLAIAIYCFTIPADFPLTGVSGIALILYHLIGTPIGMVTILLNIPIAIACYRTLGKKFYLNSLRTTLITSVMMDSIGPGLPIYEGEVILASLCAGVLCGVGYGIVFMRNSSTGGFDFIIMTVKAYKPHISIGKIAFVIDCAVIAAGGYLFGGIDAIIYGLIFTYLYSIVLDKVIYGGNYGKLTMIITDMPKEISIAIDAATQRGATLLKAVGSYSGERKDVVMCACSNKEMFAIRKLAHEVDENAFVIILESNEVIGEGFHLPGEAKL